MSFDIEEDEMFSEDNKAESNWWKKKQEGDRIFGKLTDFFVDEENEYGPQKVYVVEAQKVVQNGEEVNTGIWNVPISMSKEGTIQRADQARVGDLIAFEFSGTGEAKEGKNPAKYIEVYMRETEEGDKNEEVEDEFDAIS